MKRLIKKVAAISPEQYISGYPSGYTHSEKGLSTINVSDVIGMTKGRDGEYDDNMQPLGEPDERWTRIYERAQQEHNVDFAGPIRVVKVPDEDKYFIYDDGNHRVSVAKALGISTIQANVIDLIPKGKEENIDIEKELSDAQGRIKEISVELDKYKLQQSEIENEKMPFAEKNKKLDEIEEMKQPLYQESDELWAKVYELQNSMN